MSSHSAFRLACCIRDAFGETGETLGILESCTGGLVLSALTDVEGAGYVLGGGVAYDAGIKEKFGVPGETIDTYGVVSPQVALAMAESAAAWFQCDFGVGVTGVAGPQGDEGVEPGAGFAAVWHEGSGQAIAINVPAGERREAKARITEVVLAYLLEQLESREKPSLSPRAMQR